MTFDIRDDVCLIIDMECFFVDGQQHCRELGFCSSRGDCGRVAVSPKKPFGRLRDFDRRQAHYLTREIHGLSYAPHKHEQTVPSVRHYVAKLYAEYRTEHRTRVAYKGGTVEKCLLVSMNIPFLNLETMGCPKYDALRALDNEPPGTCGWHHIPNKHHCAMTECRAFFQWYWDYFKTLSQDVDMQEEEPMDIDDPIFCAKPMEIDTPL